MRGGLVAELPLGGSVGVLAGRLATSPSTGRRWMPGGLMQHRLLDPRTGRPAVSRWNQVTVAAGSCLATAVAAKAAFLLSDEAPDWLDTARPAGPLRRRRRRPPQRLLAARARS